MPKKISSDLVEAAQALKNGVKTSNTIINKDSRVGAEVF